MWFIKKSIYNGFAYNWMNIFFFLIKRYWVTWHFILSSSSDTEENKQKKNNIFFSVKMKSFFGMYL